MKWLLWAWRWRRGNAEAARPAAPVMATLQHYRTGELHGYTTGEDA